MTDTRHNKPIRVTPGQAAHLRALPYLVDWSNRPGAKPFSGFSVAAHDRLQARGWLVRSGRAEFRRTGYSITPAGIEALIRYDTK